MYPCASSLFLFGYDKWKLYEKDPFGIFYAGLDFQCFLNGYGKNDNPNKKGQVFKLPVPFLSLLNHYL